MKSPFFSRIWARDGTIFKGVFFRIWAKGYLGLGQCLVEGQSLFSPFYHRFSGVYCGTADESGDLCPGFQILYQWMNLGVGYSDSIIPRPRVGCQVF
ncbi:MAG: hypothetical protein DRQ02_06315 [Candidatus Latescibacterota bacterium]|nr:MAG: hypothetical protein DRQ02_06315 [Candidatus Latescibacterota bacterium]